MIWKVVQNLTKTLLKFQTKNNRKTNKTIQFTNGVLIKGHLFYKPRKAANEMTDTLYIRIKCITAQI